MLWRSPHWKYHFSTKNVDIYHRVFYSGSSRGQALPNPYLPPQKLKIIEWLYAENLMGNKNPRFWKRRCHDFDLSELIHLWHSCKNAFSISTKFGGNCCSNFECSWFSDNLLRFSKINILRHTRSIFMARDRLDLECRQTKINSVITNRAYPKSVKS